MSTKQVRIRKMDPFDDDESAPLTSPLLSESDDDEYEENIAPTTNVLRITSSSCRAGLGIGKKRLVGNPSKTIVMVKFVLADGMASSHNIQPGMIILGYEDTVSIVKRIKCGPFPFDLHFYNPIPNPSNDVGTYKSPTLGTKKLPATVPFRPTEYEKRRIVKGFLSSTFVIIHKVLFGWMNNQVMKNNNQQKPPCWCEDINSSLVSAALSREMVKKVDEGLFQEALVIADEALTVQRRCCGKGCNNPDIGRILNFIGIILSQMEDDDAHNYMALTSFEESLTIMQETLGYGDEETSFALHNMWLLLHNERERLKEDEYERNEVHTYKGALPIEA